jgi:hypothetical protein
VLRLRSLAGHEKCGKNTQCRHSHAQEHRAVERVHERFADHLFDLPGGAWAILASFSWAASDPDSSPRISARSDASSLASDPASSSVSLLFSLSLNSAPVTATPKTAPTSRIMESIPEAAPAVASGIVCMPPVVETV